MIRRAVPPRPHWRERNEALGFGFHSLGGSYWDESACYGFTAAEVDVLERATQDMNRLCLSAVDHVIYRDLFPRLGIEEPFADLCRKSWERDDPTLYGRLDFRYGGDGPPKLLEYNADTPTALLEAAVAQWVWLEEVLPGRDQFNSIHEKLLEQLSWMRSARGLKTLHFSSAPDSEEDRTTAEYLRDLATQAGLETAYLDVDEIGWDPGRGRFVDLDDREIAALFKLYPWEWLVREPFGRHLLAEPARMVEPAWKMILSNKGILPILWSLSPGHPNLLPSYFSLEELRATGFDGGYARKPLLSREGANVTLVPRFGAPVETGGGYGEEGFVYQVLAPLPDFGEAGRPAHPVIGSWVVGDAPAGVGIRESASPITDNASRFVPHYFDPE